MEEGASDPQAPEGVGKIIGRMRWRVLWSGVEKQANPRLPHPQSFRRDLETQSCLLLVPGPSLFSQNRATMAEHQGESKRTI